MSLEYRNEDMHNARHVIALLHMHIGIVPIRQNLQKLLRIYTNDIVFVYVLFTIYKKIIQVHYTADGLYFISIFANAIFVSIYVMTAPISPVYSIKNVLF